MQVEVKWERENCVLTATCVSIYQRSYKTALRRGSGVSDSGRGGATQNS